jgi:hypothetical protein
MIQLSDKWAAVLRMAPETGMGYQIATIDLENGDRFEQVTIVGGTITQIKGRQGIPFVEEDIAAITVTHHKWDFGKESATP